MLLAHAYQPVQKSSLFSCFTNSALSPRWAAVSSANCPALAELTLCPSSDPSHAVVPLLHVSVSSWEMAFWSICGPWVPYTSLLWLPNSLVSVSRGSGLRRALPLLWSFCCFLCYSVLQSCVIKLYTSSISHCQAFVKWSTQILLQKRSSSWKWVELLEYILLRRAVAVALWRGFGVGVISLWFPPHRKG